MRAFAPAWIAAPAIAAALAAGVYVAAILDRALGAMVARERRPWPDVLAGPFRTAALLLVQRRSRTERPDAQLSALAPALLGALGGVALAVVPLAPGLGVADTGAGFVLFAAAIAFVMVAVYLHGWSANSLLPLIGGYRFVIEALSYQMPLLLAVLATALPAESLAVSDIVRAQEPLWNVVRQPAGLPLYLVAATGAAFWGPLNLPDAPDLGGGTSAESSGAARLLWMVGRAAVLVAVAAMGAASFLGGWWGPWLPAPAWMILKTLALLVLIVGAGHLLARVRLERFVVVAWAALIPLALANVFVSGVLIL